jgi:predicted nucleotidyltransferase
MRAFFAPGIMNVRKTPDRARQMRQKANRAVAAMVRRIVRRFSPEKVILFGSHAAGTARPDSDVDLLIVMPITGTKAELELAIRKALGGSRVAKDIIVTTPEEFAWRKSVPGTIERPAARKGRILFEKR